MPYSFPADLNALVHREMSAGDYSTEDDVLRHALEALAYKREVERLRRHLAPSLEQARNSEVRPLDVEALLKRVEERVVQSKSVAE